MDFPPQRLYRMNHDKCFWKSFQILGVLALSEKQGEYFRKYLIYITTQRCVHSKLPKVRYVEQVVFHIFAVKYGTGSKLQFLGLCCV